MPLYPVDIIHTIFSYDTAMASHAVEMTLGTFASKWLHKRYVKIEIVL